VISFLRREQRPIAKVGLVLRVATSNLAEWNGIFDKNMQPIIMPDRRGKAMKVTPALVRTVVELATEWQKAGKRLRIKDFTRHLSGREIELSSKTVSEILIANDLYGAKVKKRRPRFYQHLRQTVPNGLVGVDGKEFIVMLGTDPHRFNLELCVDVKSHLHGGWHIADSETTEGFIKALEMHRQAWGTPLAVVADHGSANLSDKACEYLKGLDIVILPAGPGNPKGNGSVEGAFSEMAEVIGTIKIDTTSPYSLAKSIFKHVVTVYMNMRNRQPRLNAKHSPVDEMNTKVDPEKMAELKEKYRQRSVQQRMKPDHTAKYDRLHWLIDHHHLGVDEPSMARAEKCIVYYDIEVIAKAEAAFVKAINLNETRRTLPYFFGILKNIQKDFDNARYQDYCRQRYHYLTMLERERQQEKENNDTVTPNILVEMIRNAIALPMVALREIALRQAERMAIVLKKQYHRLEVLKMKILESMESITGIAPLEKQEILDLMERFVAC